MSESEMMTMDETNVMTEINVKIRCGMKTLYNTKVSLMIHSRVHFLKQKLCEMDSNLNEKLLVAVYLGNVMEDSRPIYMYKIFEDCTVHVFKRNQPENKIPPKVFKSGELIKLGVAFRSLSLNNTYKCASMKISKSELINHLIISTPELSNDPIALALLQHSELLMKLNDVSLVKRIAESHPSLALAAIRIHAEVHDQVVQNHLASDVLATSVSAGSDEDTVEDLDDSSPGSETNTLPINRNTSFAITAAQLASAIANVTSIYPQPSTSGASTSSGNSGNVSMTPNNIQSESTDIQPVDFSSQLAIMRDMGLNNEALNLQGLRLRSNLEAAIEYVLNSLEFQSDDSRSLF